MCEGHLCLHVSYLGSGTEIGEVEFHPAHHSMGSVHPVPS
jgi:hypothetical protein